MSILIKLNQIGTLTETVDCCMLANKHGLMTTTSHRGGGETNDSAMVDVAVAVDFVIVLEPVAANVPVPSRIARAY